MEFYYLGAAFRGKPGGPWRDDQGNPISIQTIEDAIEGQGVDEIEDQVYVYCAPANMVEAAELQLDVLERGR
jgi:hypothetical protein